MECFASVSYNVLWNGGKNSEFFPSRGIRQGDPIFLYLFVICMDKLSYLIEDHVDFRSWISIDMGQNGPAISHLMFAYDFVLFAKASAHQFQLITGCLSKFCLASSLKMNMVKTLLVFSKNVDPSLR